MQYNYIGRQNLHTDLISPLITSWGGGGGGGGGTSYTPIGKKKLTGPTQL